MKKKEIITLTLFVLVLCLLLPAPFVLGVLSMGWSEFGSYLSGVAAILNVGVFIYITLLVSRFNKNNKNQELKFSYKKELFIRFLSAYEQLVSEAHEHRVKMRRLTYVCKGKPENLDCDKLTTHVDNLAISFNTLRNISSSYIVDNDDMEIQIKRVITEYLDVYVYPILDTLAAGVINEHFLDHINETIQKTGNVLDDISEIMKTYMIRRPD